MNQPELQIQQALTRAQSRLDMALFQVKLSPIYLERSTRNQDDLFDNEENRYSRVPRFKAVEAEGDGHVFSVVGPDYTLITNQEAIKLGEICFDQVFELTDAKELQVFNVIMPQTRSFCHIDFIHSGVDAGRFTRDKWIPYLRITNSYNRTYALNFDLGFCRGICLNGVIFGRRNIEFKYRHNRIAPDIDADFRLRAGTFAALETQFIGSLKNLKRFHVPRKFMWPLTCKVFDLKIVEDATARQQELYREKRGRIDELTRDYFDELGESAYAALNVLTDFASRPAGIIAPASRIHSMQRRAGDWIIDFVSAIEQRDFSFESYLGNSYSAMAQ